LLIGYSPPFGRNLYINSISDRDYVLFIIVSNFSKTSKNPTNKRSSKDTLLKLAAAVSYQA
jgi:hypothetical protein